VTDGATLMLPELSLPWLLCVALLTVRLTVALALSPALSAYGVPAAVRVALTMLLAALTFADRAPPAQAMTWASDPASMLVPVMSEVLIGALLGLGVHIVLAALALAGRLMDVQTGFAIGSVFDPVTRTSSNVFGTITALLGVVLFVLSNAHLQLAQLIAHSLEVLPLGTLPAFDDPMKPLLAAGSMFTLGLAFAAPVAIALLLTDLVIGVASRNMPQVNVFVLAIPIKVVIAYLVLAFSIIGWSPLLQRSFSRVTGAVGLY
jgi:flagellar biosynthetic protein FliR